MNIIAIKSKLNNFSLLNGFTSNTRHDTSVLLEGNSIHKVQWITSHSEYIFHDSRLYFITFPIHALFTGQFTGNHAKPLTDPDLTGTGGKDL